MKIEKITDNKIRIVIELHELEDNNIDLDNFVFNNLDSQRFFLEILNKAEKEVGFKTKNCKLLIESFSSLNEVFVFTITKFSDIMPSNQILKLKNNTKRPILKNPIFQFNSFEEFRDFCFVLNNSNVPLNGIAKKISLYLYNDTYYLIFAGLNLDYKNFKWIFSLLSEFSTSVKNKTDFEARILEYGKPIIKQNAFKTMFRYFI